MLTMMYAPNTITQAPVARPSSPSVRSTALLVPVTITQKIRTATSVETEVMDSWRR